MPELLPARRPSGFVGVSSSLTTVLMAVVVVSALYFGREVLVPIALAVLMSFVLAPLVRLLQRWFLPRIVAVAIVVLIAFGAVFSLGSLMVSQVNQLAVDLPRYQSTLREAEELDALIYPIQYDTSDYARSMQGGGNSVTVVTTTHGLFGTKTSQQTYNVPGNNGMPMPGTSKADYDRADKYLHALANETGGRLYQANDTTQLADSFSRIAEELRRQYSLGYYPKSDNADDNARREIKVRVKRPDLAVKARDNYTKSSGANPNK